MSYILDALRRAEADRERERGRVPGLHTPPQPGGLAVPAAGPRRWLPWAGGGVLLLAGIGAGSWWAGGPQDAPAPAPSPMPASTPAAALAAPPAPTTAPLPAPPQAAAPLPPPAPAPAVSPYLAPAAPPPVAVAPAPPAVAPSPAPTPAPVPAPAADERIPRVAELPEATRRELPKLVISGSVFSDNPSSRFVMVNGDVVREGARLGDDLVLEQIRQHELVLRFKGQRYRQPV